MKNEIFEKKDWDFQYVDFWIKCGFLPQRVSQGQTSTYIFLDVLFQEFFSSFRYSLILAASPSIAMPSNFLQKRLCVCATHSSLLT